MTTPVTVVHNIPVDTTGALLGGAAVTIVLVTAADTSPGYTATQSIVAPTVVYTDAVTGQWTANLIPNTSITPSGTYYRVTEPNGEISTIQVPAAGGPYALLGLLVSAPATPATQYIPTSAEGVAGGVATLDGTANVPLAQLGNAPTGAGTPSNTVTAETSYSQASAGGSSSAYSRGDHTHGTPALPTPAAIGAAPTSRQVDAGTGLSGGGDLSADRTLNVTYGTSAGTAAQGNDARITGAVQASTVTAKGDLLVGTGSATVVRLPVGSDGQVLTADAAQTDGVKWAAASGGGTSLHIATTGFITSGDVTVNAGGFVQIGTDLTVTASAGDILVLHPEALASGASGGDMQFDAATRVGGNDHNWWSSGTGTTRWPGALPPWYVFGSQYTSPGPAHYVVQAGDVVTGQVTVRFYAQIGAAARIVLADSNYPTRLWLTNLGPGT